MASYGATKTPLWTMLYVRHLLWVDDLRVDDPRVDRELVVAVEGRVACAWSDVWVWSEGNNCVRGRLTSGWGGAGGQSPAISSKMTTPSDQKSVGLPWPFCSAISGDM